MAAVVGIDQAAYAIHDALADTYFVRDLYDALQR
ncbi:DNA polymerase III epsilon subunit-like protein [Kribbella aluminosa]|uniref:DNA polymerase III epsilon subunit-like protein n=1 Tax=Kribbella aluminosa TaxID=416017 RepID=A0ABS4URJ6_9ACTN|nr:DNA polymerase III epsilon subunit-like protein [Kribbella aluminosa]